jgi:hypothetical protein
MPFEEMGAWQRSWGTKAKPSVSHPGGFAVSCHSDAHPMCEPPAVLVLRTVTFDVVGNGSVAKFHPRSLGRLFVKLVGIGFFHRELPATSRLALGIPHMLSGMA